MYERKRKLKEAIASGKALPTELRRDEAELRHEIALDDEVHGTTEENHMDDEYVNAGVRDPKVMLTTSREPSSRLKQFVKEMRLVIPGSQRINRGGYVIKDIMDACRKNEVTDLVVVHEHRGEPDGLVVCHLPHGPTAFFGIANTVMRHDIEDKGTISEAFPHLIFDNFNTALGERTRNILKHLFPVPKEDSKRVMTFANTADFISFRHHVYERVDGNVEIKEVGPRFEMRLYEIRLGTLEQTDAENEWTYKPYQNSTKRRMVL